MTKLLLMLMVVGVWSGCGGDRPTKPTIEELLVGTWAFHTTEPMSFSFDGIDVDLDYGSTFRTCEYKKSGHSECRSVLYEGLIFYRWRIEDNLFYEVPIQYEPSYPWIIEFLDDDTVLITDSNAETTQYVGKRKKYDD